MFILTSVHQEASETLCCWIRNHSHGLLACVALHSICLQNRVFLKNATCFYLEHREKWDSIGEGPTEFRSRHPTWMIIFFFHRPYWENYKATRFPSKLSAVRLELFIVRDFLPHGFPLLYYNLRDFVPCSFFKKVLCKFLESSDNSDIRT